MNSYLPATPAKLLEKAVIKTATKCGEVLPMKVLPYLPSRKSATTTINEYLLVRLSIDCGSWKSDWNESYGLIMSRSLKQASVGSQSIAVLGSVVKGTSAAGEQYLRLNHIGHATVQRRTGMVAADVEHITSQEVGEETEWLVG